MVDILGVAEELGQIDYAVEFGDSTFRYHLERFVEDVDLCSFEDHFLERKHNFVFLLDNFYECCTLLAGICYKSYSDFGFVEKFVENFYQILVLDL